MADLTDRDDVATVRCPCAETYDPTELFQCPRCGRSPDDALPDTNSRPAGAAPGTVVESGAPPATAGIGVVVRGIRFAVADGETLMLGRDDDLPTATALRNDGNVSRFHASVRLQDGRLHITDMSTNGTFVNGNRLTKGTEYEVLPHQTIRFASDVPIELDWPDR